MSFAWRPLLVLLLALGCGGNWSDDDLVFASALPWRGDLRLTLPEATGPSRAWTATRAAAGEVNGLLDRLLGVMDQARASAPTSRTAEGRAWGPFAAGSAPSTTVSLEMAREEPSRFTWSLTAQALGGQPAEVMAGQTLAGATLRAGRFTLQAPLGPVRELLALPSPLDAVERVELEALPGASLALQLQLRPGAASTLSPSGYHATWSASATSLRFTTTREDASAELTARWNATGAGRAEGTLLDGPNAGARFTECWSGAFETTWLEEAWPGGTTAGDVATCPALE